MQTPPPPITIPMYALQYDSREPGFACAMIVSPSEGNLPTYISWGGRYFDKGLQTVFPDIISAQKYVQNACYPEAKPSVLRKK